MPNYCLFIKGEFNKAYVADLIRFSTDIYVHQFHSEYISIECNEDTIEYLFDEFIWIDWIEPDEPMPIFWNQWSEEE